MAGKFGFTIILAIAACIFVVQTLMSTWWLRHFKFGPIEWIWRQLTYGKSLNIKKEK